MMRTNKVFLKIGHDMEKNTQTHRQTMERAQGIKLFGIVVRDRPLMIFSTSFATVCVVDIINHDTNKEFVPIYFLLYL